MSRHKTTSEIFGHQINEEINKRIINKIKRSGYQCPFLCAKCKKQSRLISYPMGVCSVYQNNIPIIICPSRFTQNKIIFKDIANIFFGDINNTLCFPEVKLKNIGSFDFVLVKHKPLSAKIEDFIIVEIQSDSTTGTGKLVKNFEEIMKGDKSTMNKHYSFGMNTYNTIKLSFIQMLNKGIVVKLWNKNIVWVMQNFIFQNMLNRFELNQQNDFDQKKNNHFFIYSLQPGDKLTKEEFFGLSLDSKTSLTVDELIKAFSTNRSIPPLDKFIEKLENKVRIELKIDN